MTLTQEATASWFEPDSIPLRGTLVVLPGRGESPTVYERFGRRLAADSYRVHAVTAPSEDTTAATAELAALFAGADPGLPRLLVGSDAGALYAAQQVAQARLDGVSGLILAGLPTVGGGPVGGRTTTATPPGWETELDARTLCGTHRGRLEAGRVRRGELYDALPPDWFEAAAAELITVPVLGLHGQEDSISPVAPARAWYARAPRAELVTTVGGRHDALNDQTHRSVAATVVLFLERLRQGIDVPPIVVPETLNQRRPGRD